MASFLHQLKVLLWKNWLGVYRQPVWSMVLIIWPVVIFIILAVTRSRIPPTQSPDCYLSPRNLQSTGMIPFLQNFLCDTDTKCSNKSFTSNTVTSKRLQKRSVYSGGGGYIPQMRSTNDSLATLWNSTAGENLDSILNKMEVVKTALAKLSAEDLKGAMCTIITLLSTTQQSAFQDFCNSNQTLASLALKALSSQASGSNILTTLIKISTGVNYVQNKKALWNILFMFPEWIINPSLIFEGDRNLFLSQVYPDIADLQPCIKYIVKTATQVQNQSSTNNQLGILEIISDQSMKNDMKSCISFFQKVSCGTSPCWLNMNNTFEKIYWLMSSLTDGAPSTVCEFNGLTIKCNGTINLDMFLESVLTAVNETSRNPSAVILRYVQQAWTLLKQNRVDEMILQQLEQTIATSYPANPQLQTVLTQLVHLLINTTDILIQSNSEQYIGVLQTLLDQINVLIGSELLDIKSLNISSIVTNLTQSIVKEVQYLMNLSSLLSTSNVYSQSLVELQTLISSLSDIISDISTLNNTELLQDLAITNQLAFNELQKILQTLMNINPITSNITNTIINELIKTSLSSALDVYLKEILQFLNGDVALVNNLAFLNSYLNYTQLDFLQSEAFGRYAGNILSFFTPSNLEEISSNPNNVSLELLKLMAGFFPSEEKETFNKVENIFMRLLGLVSTCQTEYSNCTSAIIVFQQQLSDIMQYINYLNSGNMESIFDSGITLTFVNLSHTEISIVNTMLEIISCSQAPKNISCDTNQDFYRTIIGQVSSVINTALVNESNLVSIVPTLNQIKENVNSVFQVLQSVDVTNFASEIDTITQLSKCYTNATVNPIQCTMELSLSLVDYLQILPFPPSVHNTLFVASSIVKNWLGATKVTTDMYQQLSSLYNLSSMAFYNQSTLVDIYTNLLYIVQQLEELRGNVNMTSVATEKLIQDLLETLKLANITYTFPTSLLSQTSEGLQMIKTQLQTIKWYIAFVKNEADTFQSTGNIDTFVTMAQLLITNIQSSMEKNNSFVPIADEILNVINWLQTSHIIPVLQSILDDSLNNEGQSLETLINHTVSVIEMIIQQVFVNGTRWTSSLNNITDNDITFMVQLLQKYDNGQLTNLSSVLLFTEKVLLTMESLVNDLNLETGFIYNLQTVFNISQEVINLLHNAEQNISVSKNVLYDVYSLLLEGWNGSIFNEFPMLKNRLMDLLYLSMQCLPESTDSFPSQNCSVTDFINVTQQILLMFKNQTKVGLSTIEGNVTLNNILDYVLNSIYPVNISIAKPEIAIVEELACLTTMLNITLKAVSRVSNQVSLNTTWILDMDKALVKITEKFSTFNITCLTIDQKMVNIIYQLFENQSNFLQSFFPLLSDQTSYWTNPSQYGYMDEMFNIIKLYAATQGNISLNNTMINLWNDTLLKILESNPNSSEWVLVSEIVKILRNTLTDFETTEGSKEFLAIMNRVADLTVASLQLNTSLSHVSIANIFKNNSSTVMYNLIKLMTLENATSIEDCKSTFLNLLTFYQSNMSLSLVESFYSNMSSWTCTMLFSNISDSNWQDELKAITDIMVSLQPGAQTNATMKIISSFMQFVTFTNMDTFENFVASIIQNFIGNNPQTNSTVFHTSYDLIKSLQSIVTQLLSSNSASTVEKISIQAIETVHVFLRSLNITGYDEMFTFASDILQVYFDFRNSTLPLENLAQKILGQILTSFQESGLQNVTLQLVQSEILSLSSEEQKIAQFVLSMVVSAINETISDIELQPPSYNNNLVFNIIKNIVKNFAIEDLGGNKNLTELIFSLVTDILQIAENWNNVSVAIVFPQNGSSESVKALEALMNDLISQNSSDSKLYYNCSTNMLNIFAMFFAKGEKDQVMQTIQYFLNLSNGTINAPALVNTLENFYDLLNLNKTVGWNLLELYVNQLFSFISNSQINKTFLDFSFLFNTSQKLFSSQTNEISYAALELLPFFYPSNLYNISKNSDSLVSTLLNVLSKNVPQDQQLAIRNFTDSILSLMELIEKCSNNSAACESAVSGFEVLTINVVNVITHMGNGTQNLEISNKTLMELETLTDLQILLINNIFSLFWNVQTTTGNLSGDVKNIYQDILSVSQLILNFTKNSNASTVQSDLEMLKNYTHFIDIIQKVASVNNVTNELLQIMNLQKDFQCTNQTLLCILNFTSHFLRFLQELQVPQPLMEKVLAASSIAEYWLREINTTVDVYQQMVSLFELTRTTLQNEPTLQTILQTLTDISKIIQDMKMDNTSFHIVKDLILNTFNVLEGNLLNSSKSPLHIDSTVLENLQTQIKIIEWYMIYIKNLTENHNMFGDPYALYRLIQISLIDMMASVENWVQFSNMSNLSSYETENLIQLLTRNETGNWTQLENVIHLLEILQQINSIQGLNTVNITTIWQVINKIMTGELNVTQIEEIVKVLQASIITHNITEGAEFLQLYNFILGILNQTYSSGDMNFTPFLQSFLESFLAMDCQSVSRISTAVYKIILNATNQLSPWVDEMFFSNFTLDVCTLLHWNNSQDDWLTLLHVSEGLISYAIPLAPDSMQNYFHAAEYILVVAAEFLAEPDLTQKNIMNILNVVPAINELFNTSAMDWVQNGTFQKLFYFLVDLAWTSSSPKDVLLLKVQKFTITMVQDIQNMLKAQPASVYNAWMTFALEVVETIINGTQDPSSEERLLKQVWDLFKQNDLEKVIISEVNDLVLNNSFVNAKLLDNLLQLVFTITDSVILDTPLSLSNVNPNTTIKVLHMALSSIIQTFLPQYENFTLEFGGLQTGMNITTIFSELQLLLNSVITMQIPTNVTNIEANIFNLLSKYAQIILGSNNTPYMKLLLEAQKMIYEFSQTNTTITLQQLSAIFANYLPMFVGSNNETQAYLYTILNMWQYLNNLTGALSNDLNNITVEMLPMFQSLLNENTNVSELMSWLVNIISVYIPIEEQDRLHKVANATQHLIGNVQTCRVNSVTCPNLIEKIQNFVSDVTQLETFMQNRNLANSSVLHFGLYNQSQTLINEIYLLLSNAMGHPYNYSSSQGGVYEYVLTLKDWIFNTTMEENLNFTTSLSPQTIIEVLNSVNITNLLHQVENVVQTSTCANQTDKDAFLCKLNATLQLTQLVNQLPLGHTIHADVSVISSLLEQWIINFNTDISIYQQLIDLHNVTVLTLQYQPILQAVNTSLVSIVHRLQDMGILQNISMKETDIVSNTLSEIIQQLDSGPILYNLSTLLKYNVTELLESIQFTLDIVNWLMLHSENQTEIFPQWMINHYQVINIIIRDIESVVNSFNPLSPNATIDALTTLVEDLLTEFLPKTEDKHLTETLQIVLNVTKILLELTGPKMINHIQMFINNVITFQSDISNNPTKLFLLAMNQTGLISEIVQFIQSFVVSKDAQFLPQFLDILQMFNNFAHMNKTITLQDLSTFFVKYLQFHSETANDVQSSLNAIFNLWQYLNNLTNGQSNDSSNTVLQMLPFLESHLLLNENTNISEIMSWLVNLLSRYVPPEELNRFEKAANASMHVIEVMEACAGNSMTCIDITKAIENFLADVAQLETLVHNRTLTNDSLLQFQSYSSSQIVLMNELLMMLSYVIDHSLNISTNQNGVYEDLLNLKNMLLNTTIEEDFNLTIPLYLQDFSEVLASANISQVLLQVEILLSTSTCNNQTDIEPFLCKLNMTFQLTQFLSQLPLPQTIHDNISTISLIVKQWLSHLDNMSTYQQLLELYNLTVLAFDHEFTLQAINTSLINITHILHDVGILQNVSLNESDIAMTVLFEMIQLFHFGPVTNNLSIVLHYNISGILETIQSQLHIMDWLILQVAKTQWNFNSSLTGDTIYSIAQWIQDNNQYISLILREIEPVISPFNNFFNLTDIIYIFNMAIQNKPIQSLIYQIGGQIQGFTNISFIWNLLDKNMQTDAEMVWLLLREMESTNISLILTFINQLQQTIQDIKGLDLASTFSNNTISAKVFTIITEGMKIVNNIQAKGTIAKEDIYQIYNFTYLLVQGEQTWVPFQNISAMEDELLDVFYLAMTPFLGGNGSQVYNGNCTAQNVLQILIHTIFNYTTVNKSQEVTTCNWQFIYNSSDATTSTNRTLSDMIYLALQSSPVFHTVCSNGNLQPLAEEMACLIQVVRFSMSILAELNNMSGFQTSLIQTLNDSLTYICSNMPDHNSTFQTEIQIMKNLDAIFLNQSNPVYMLIQLLCQHYNSTFQTPVLQQVWTQISTIIKTFVPMNESVDSPIYELIETAVNLTMQPNWLQSGQNLQNILSMNWTVSNIDSSLSILETIRRAVVFIDGFTDVNALQIYQAIVLLVKNPNFSLLFNATSSQLINTTMSSVAECTDIVNAVANFSSSVWPIFDQSQSELLSSFGLLACNTLYIQSTNYSWTSNLDIISNILSNLANYELIEMTGYFTAIEKIISLLSEVFQSTNISQEILLNTVYELFIQELRLFSNSTVIIDWLEKIPVRNLTNIFFGSSNNATFDQVLVLETDLLQLLSRSLNATSYTQGISILSDSLMTLAKSISSLTGSSGIIQQLTNNMTTLAVIVQIPPLAEPYGSVLNCVKYVADNLTDQQMGHLDVAIQDLFTQSNELANGSMVPKLLNEKIYELKNLTTILCTLNGSNNSQSYCYVPCQYLRVLQEVTDIATAGIQAVPTAQSFSTSPIITLLLDILDGIYMDIEHELDKMISSVVPVNEVANITLLLSNFLNITNLTSGDVQTLLGSVFHDRSHVEGQLKQIVKLNQTSVTALMNVQIPSNKTYITDWFFTLYQCGTNPSLVDEPLQVFCNLSSLQGYQMAIIFLQNVDILQVLYNFLVPTNWQKTIQILINALNEMNAIFKNVPSEEEIKFLLNILQKFLVQQTNSARQKRSTDSQVCFTKVSKTPSLTDITSNLCKGNYCAVGQILCALYQGEIQSLSNQNSARAQPLDKLYGIPTDNPFCRNIFTKLVNTTSGANTWTLMKPVLYGKILYTPNTNETQKIMEKTNSKLVEVQNYQKSATDLSSKIQNLLDNWKYITLVMELVPKLKAILNNTVVAAVLQEFLHLNAMDLSANLTKATSFIQFLITNKNYMQTAQAFCKILSSLLSCTSYDRVQPLNSVTEMMAKASELQKTNELFAAVTFDLPSSTSRKKRSASGLPKNIKYTISMRSVLSEDTSALRDSYWIPGPHARLNKYSLGFVYLQENIDRAIIELQTKKSLDNVGAQYQPMPYPCYNKDSFLYSMAFSLPIALMITWVLFIASFVKKLVHEKELRLHEYMKMMGIKSFNHFFAWFIECASFLLITVAILVLILKFGKILPQSNGFILFIFFLDYSLTIIAMSYLISVFFHNTNVAALSGSLVYIITFFPFIVVVSKETMVSFAGKTLLSLFSPTALSYATQYIVRYEQQNEGIQWHNMYTSPMINDTFSFGWLCWIMLIDAMIYFIVGGYIRTVFPGQYGIGAPWYFPVLPSFWMECCGLQNLFSKKPSGLIISNLVSHGIANKKAGDDLYPQNEPEPTDLNVGVSLHGLTKIYRSKAAVENLNLNFYEGHITSLLGPNGAGKTTTLSMLTGLFSASSGTIYVYGNDIRTHLEQTRKDMGVCMQYDVLFDHLTTKEHLLLYGSIKAPQWDKKQLHEEVKRTLKETGLYKHCHKPVKALSGGMKRKLSICIALIGGSKVVILDEPTTGVDPCSRRSIWEVISKNKKDKTIILSTHHLDEAEVLSDRIAFLEKGGLKCCGTPRFLKEKFGSGYRLTLTKKFPNQKEDEICNSEQVTALIQSHIPEAILKEDVGGELVYVLPPFSAEISGAYLSLLRDLDSSLNDLHIGCYGISDTTIEEVFLKLTDGLDEDEGISSTAVLISNKDHLMVDDESSTNSYSFLDRDDQPLTRRGRVTGFKLMFKKVMAMFIKRFHNSKRNWKGLISQILLPVLFVIAAMGLGSLSMGYVDYPELLLSPELYGSTEQAVVFGISDNKSQDLVNAMNSFPGLDNACLDQNMQCLAETSLGSWTYVGNQTLTYGACNCSTGSMICNAPDAVPPHRMTYSKQMMYNLTGQSMEGYLLTTALQFVQRRYGGWSFGIPTSQITSLLPVPENLTLSKVWYNNEGPHSLPSFLNSFSNFLLKANRQTNDTSQYSISVYNKPLSGNVAQGTITSTLVNTLVALSVLVGYSITTASFVIYVVKEYDNGSKRLQHIAGIGKACYWLTNFLYDLAIYFIPVALSIAIIAAFKLPSFYDYPNLGAVSLLFVLFGYATFSWMYLISGTFKSPGMAFISYVCINLFIGINTIISSSVVYMLVQQKGKTDPDYQSLNNTYNVLINVFKIFPQFCFGYGLILLSQEQAIADQLTIYGTYDKPDVFGMDILGYMYVALVIQGTFCFILRLLINDEIIYSLKTFVKKTCLKRYNRIPLKNPDEDEDVRAERERVDIGNANSDLLVVQGLTKIFHQVKRNLIAVNNMTLGIPPGECFGLLGVNGAGKTTTFKMLTGEISPSSGNIQTRNHFGNLVNVLGFNTDWSSFGYCPQEDALDELMTGEEHLYYYARIHGIPEKEIKRVANQLLQKLQLVQYKDRITASYSCGTRRKLSTALALVGKPSILLLDEPSSGMDPKTKRHLWKIISEEVRDKCAVILTSHSMEECEALCTRLAIMVKGKFQCIGSLQHIKSRFGSGFTVKMHLKDSSISIETITSFMHSHFPNTFLKEQHFTMAEYHVPVSAGGVASIFDLLESQKKHLNIIHFSVSQTTLDEVFINFAQSQSSPDNSRESGQETPQLVVI